MIEIITLFFCFIFRIIICDYGNIPIPESTTIYAPSSFVITGVQVSNFGGIVGKQYVEILKFNDPVSDYPTLTNNFVRLELFQDGDQGTFLPCSVMVTSGDYIGILGALVDPNNNEYEAACGNATDYYSHSFNTGGTLVYHGLRSNVSFPSLSSDVFSGFLFFCFLKNSLGPPSMLVGRTHFGYCEAFCVDCFNVNCYECLPGYYLYNRNCYAICPLSTFIYGVECFSICPDQTFPNTTNDPGTCVDCSDQTYCLECTDENTCIHCETRYLYLGECVEFCPSSGYFYWDDGVDRFECRQCTNPTYCKNCTDNSTCIRCVGYYLHSGECIEVCPDGFYEWNDGVDYECRQCTDPTYCLNCTDGNTCTHCYVHYLENDVCVADCQTGYFKWDDGIDRFECRQCTDPTYCLDCTDENNCTHCDTRYLYLGECVESCPASGYFYWDDGVNRFECRQCTNPTYCKNCTDDSTCVRCVGDYLHSGECIGICPDGFYEWDDGNDYECRNCTLAITGCSECDSATTCTSCFPNVYIYNDDQCYDTCPVGTFYYDNNMECVDSCPIDGYFEDTQNDPGNCVECTNPTYCEFCDDAVTCTHCSIYYLLSGECVEICPAGFYEWDDGNNYECRNCTEAISGCDTCDNANTCTDCLNGYFFHENTCTDDCPSEGAYFNDGNVVPPSCSACESNCDACDDSTVCSECLLGYYLLGGDCEDSCPSTYYKDDNAVPPSCRNCELNCDICDDSTVCVTCSQGYYLFSADCTNDCSEHGDYINSDTTVPPSCVESSATDLTGIIGGAVGGAVGFILVIIVVIVVIILIIFFLIRKPKTGGKADVELEDVKVEGGGEKKDEGKEEVKGGEKEEEEDKIEKEDEKKEEKKEKSDDSDDSDSDDTDSDDSDDTDSDDSSSDDSDDKII